MINSLEEAIKHCEEVATENEKNIGYYTIQGDKEWLDECGKDCIECAKEHRQLAEWLKRLKRIEDYIVDGNILYCNSCCNAILYCYLYACNLLCGILLLSCKDINACGSGCLCCNNALAVYSADILVICCVEGLVCCSCIKVYTDPVFFLRG